MRRSLALLLLLVLTRAALIPETTVKAQATYQVYLPLVIRPELDARGVGMPRDHINCGDMELLNAMWSYDWSAESLCGGVPMVWRDAPETVGAGAYLLVFNEPNNPGQANLTPAQAVTIAQTVSDRFPEKKLIIGGTYDGYGGLPTGYAWLTEFLALYQGRIDGIHFHCYHWTASECIAVGQGMLSIASQYNLAEVWVTEFAFFVGWNQRTQEQAWAEAETFIAWMRTQPIQRFAWFAARVYGDEPWAPPAGWYSPLINSDGTFTYAGERYGTQ